MVRADGRRRQRDTAAGVRPIWLIPAARVLTAWGLVGLLLIPGCTLSSPSGETQPAPNHPPMITAASLSPSRPTLGKTLVVQIQSDDLDGDVVGYRYQWFVNDSLLQGAVKASLPLLYLKRGDHISAGVLPSDGKDDGSPVRTADVIVANAAPVVTAGSIDVASLDGVEYFIARLEAQDADGDAPQFRVRWYRNKQEIALGDTDRVSTTAFMHGDVVSAMVTPYDTWNTGKPWVMAANVTKNHPPTIISQPPVQSADLRYVYQVVAEDEDHDPLAYALEEAPAGMEIEKRTGRLEWAVPVHASGSYHVRLMVSDGRDAYAYQEFTISMTEPGPAQ